MTIVGQAPGMLASFNKYESCHVLIVKTNRPLLCYRHSIDVCKAVFELKKGLTDIYRVPVKSQGEFNSFLKVNLRQGPYAFVYCLVSRFRESTHTHTENLTQGHIVRKRLWFRSQ